MEIRRFDLDSRGLARVLGELEARILDTVWAIGRPTVKDVTDALGADAHVKTTMTVMNRMVAKSILRRERQGRAYYYVATSDRDAFMTRVAGRVVDGLLDDFRRPALAHLIDAADPQALADLEDLIRSRRDGH